MRRPFFISTKDKAMKITPNLTTGYSPELATQIRRTREGQDMGQRGQRHRARQ